MLQETISFSYIWLTTTESAAASNTENADPNVYQTYNDIVAGFSPNGNGTWQSFSQAGSDLSEFFITLPQAGTYDYYTQEETAPGVTSGQLRSGTVTVQ